MQAGSLSDEETIGELEKRLQVEERGKGWGKLCLLQGLLATGQATLLLGQARGAGDSNTLILRILPTIVQLCSTPSSFTFHSFSLLKLWSSRLSSICQQVVTDTEHRFTVTVPESLVREVLQLCAANFESSHRGVPDACLVTYRQILTLTGVAWSAKDRNGLLSSLLTEVLSLPWSQKAKYPTLIALLPEVGLAAVLAEAPMLPAELVTSLASVHLVRAGTEVFTLLCSQMTPGQWEKGLGPVLLRCLTGGISYTVHQKCLEHWLQPSLRLQPSCLQWLLDSLPCEGRPALLTRLTLAKLGDQQDDKELLLLLTRCCAHPDPDLRAAALGAICQSGRTAPKKDELELVLNLLHDSATVPCTKFRQRVAASLNSLVAKCREEAAKCFREQQQQEEEVQTCTERLRELLAFLDKSLKVLFLHLLPGGNYQRRSFALDLIQVFVNNLFDLSSKEAKRSHGNSTTVLAMANKEGQLELFSANHLQLLVGCLEDHMGDVVEKAAKLLALWTPGEKEQKELVEQMLKLTDSSKEAKCHSGAVMAGLLQHWGAVIPKENNIPKEKIKGRGERVDLGWQLVERARLTLLKCKKDLVGSAWHGPLHGVLTAVRHCLKEHLDMHQVGVVLTLVEDTVDLMLSLLTGHLSDQDRDNSSSYDENADFQQMAESISKLVAEEGEAISIPESHLRVLSMAWHCLKEASLLAAHLIGVGRSTISTDQLSRCTQVFLNVASTCRHKGAMEAAGTIIYVQGSH